MEKWEITTEFIVCDLIESVVNKLFISINFVSEWVDYDRNKKKTYIKHDIRLKYGEKA